jgi:hypothetical protein
MTAGKLTPARSISVAYVAELMRDNAGGDSDGGGYLV